MHPAALLKSLNISALKALGQNFLVNTHSLKGSENYFNPEETLLEIGPGLGALTAYFTAKGFRMILCETDRTLASYLRREYQETEMIENDFLQTEPELWAGRKVTAVVSNLPFYITTPVLFRILQSMPFIKHALLGMQREVAERILQKKGSSLAVYTNSTGEVRLHSHISRNSFYPAPNVDASWLYWRRREIDFNADALELLLRGAFWGRRKTLRNTLLNNPFFSENTLALQWPPVIREETALEPYLKKRADALSIDDFHAILKILNG